MRGNQEIIRQVGLVDKEVEAATISALQDGLIPYTWKPGIEVGTRVPGRFSYFTGLVIYWQPDC